MRISEILLEAFPYPPGSEMPPGIIDYRDSSKAKGGWKWAKANAKYNFKAHRYYSKQPETHIALTKDGGVIVFFYSDYNTVPWRELCGIVDAALDKNLQDKMNSIIVHSNGYLIDRSRETGAWAGDRNKFSQELKTVGQAMLDRQIASASTPIWLGNWAGNKGERIGTVGSIVATQELPARITLYHGTSSFRLAQIMKDGLRPLSLEDRVWNSGSTDKNRPAHREDSVYLTASRPQAEYYAKKAMNIDRARNNINKRDDLRRKISNLQHVVTNLEWRQDHHEVLSSEESTQLGKAKELIARYEAGMFYGKFEPVLFTVTIPRSEYDRFMADDDYLQQNPTAKPEDWMDSLSKFGQVAYRGTIKPSRIKIIAQGKDAGQKSH